MAVSREPDPEGSRFHEWTELVGERAQRYGDRMRTAIGGIGWLVGWLGAKGRHVI